MTNISDNIRIWIKKHIDIFINRGSSPSSYGFQCHRNSWINIILEHIRTSPPHITVRKNPLKNTYVSSRRNRNVFVAHRKRSVFYLKGPQLISFNEGLRLAIKHYYDINFIRFIIIILFARWVSQNTNEETYQDFSIFKSEIRNHK